MSQQKPKKVVPSVGMATSLVRRHGESWTEADAGDVFWVDLAGIGR